MWPRLLELLPKLIDALPHIDRFSSLADRLLSTSADSEAAHAAMIDEVQKDLNRLDRGNVALSRQMDGLTAQITTVGEAADGSRRVTIALGHTIVAIERQLRALRSLLVAVLVLVAILILLVGWLLVTRPAAAG